MLAKRLYPIGLHLLLVGLAISSVLLVRQNRELRERLTPPPQETAFAAGQEIPPIPIRTLDGVEKPLSLAASDRQSLVFFFTTTCGACRENQAQWKRLGAGLGASLNIVGISLDGVEETLSYRDQQELPYETVAAVDAQALVQALELDLVPETVLLDEDGRVVRSWLGILEDEDLLFLGLPV